MQYIKEQGFGQDMAFELGNEPNYFALKLDGKRIGQDFLILKDLLQATSTLKNAPLVGPDIHNIPSISAPFAATVKDQISAFTLHSYYFNGMHANVADYYNVKYFDNLEQEITSWRDLMWKNAGTSVPLWIGETSDSNNKGTKDVTNRYVSGFLWLDKLGIASRNGYKLVARQDFFGGNYPLISDELSPNPDYWLSYVFKQLVGTKVLNVTIKGSDTQGLLFRVYGHCVSTRSKYQPGSIALFMVNINSDVISYNLDSKVYGDSADLYIMTPENGDILSPYVNLNGSPLKMIDAHTLPVLKGVEIPLAGPIVMPRMSYGFLVLKHVTSNVCSV